VPRFLVHKYPCRDCGEPVQVQRRRDIPHAICDRCMKRRDLFLRAQWANEEAGEEFRKVNGKAELVPLLIGCLKAAQKASRAAQCWLEALDFARPNELRRLAKLARGRADWAADLLQQLDPFMAEVLVDESGRAPVREVIRGGGEAPTPSPTPALRLVLRELEPAQDGPPPTPGTPELPSTTSNG